jgi:hypothetical protein
MAWVRDDRGRLSMDKDVIRKIAALEPRAVPFVRLRSHLSALEDFSIPYASDGRLRVDCFPLGTRTGRNRSKARENLFLQPGWVRYFVLAPYGHMLAQLDFTAEEVFVAAAFSEDRQLLHDLEGDVYLALAIRSGFAPAGATAESHGDVRELFKPALLSLIYGAGEFTLARKLGIDISRARAIKNGFQHGYRSLWEWLNDVVYAAFVTGTLDTPLGWPLAVGPDLDLRTLRNHVIQSTGGDILRASCLLLQEAGLGVINTLHDSILIESAADRIDEQAARAAVLMSEAAQTVIGISIPVKVEFKAQRYRLKGRHAAFFHDVIQSHERPPLAV